MLPANALAAWSQACAPVDVPWHLYRETLLCANGYHKFPDNLEYAQVVVFAKDLPVIMESVFPLLPNNWNLVMQDFVTKRCRLSFEADGRTVLSIDVLYPVEGEAHMKTFSAHLNQIRSGPVKIIRYQNLFEKLLGLRMDRLLAKAIRKRTEKAFHSAISLAHDTNEDLPFYCDAFTNKRPLLFDRTLFGDTKMIACEEGTYPVFSGYHQYLELVYGDYEAGLFDDIGVGLTAEQKEALRDHQARCKEALAFLQELGREFGLRYYLIAGSVLGPVRHGGFIPWDDDVDIGIRIEELEQFEALVKEHLPSRLPAEFTLEQSGANNPYPRMFSKICYEGRCCIDLWPLVPTYIDGARARLTWYFAKLITKAHYYKIGHKVTRFLKIVKPLCLFLNDRQIMALARCNERKYAGRNTPAYINLYSIYRRNKETIRREWLDTPATLYFDNLEVPVVGCTEQYLEHLYGDYMSPPAPWKRASHHVERFHTNKNDPAE